MAENLINKRFVLFEKRANFEANKANLANECIVFIADQQKIWTQGQFFTKDAFTQYQIGNKTYSPNDGWDPVNEAELADSIIKFVAGEGLVASAGTNGEVTYSLATAATVDKDEEGVNTGKFIKEITVDKFGRIAGIEYAEVGQDSYELSSAKEAADGKAKISFTRTNALDAEDTETVEIGIKGKAKDKILVTSDSNGNIEIAHKTGSQPAITGETGEEGETVAVINGLTNDAWGHLTAATRIAVPTKIYVDNEIKKVEDLVGTSVDAALILMGIAQTSDDLGKDVTPKRGHTYKVGAQFEFINAEGATEKVKPGDVIICVSDEEGAVKWSAIQSNVDIAVGGALGLVKQGSDGTAGSGIYGVKVADDGSMTVTVPEQHIPEVSSKVVTGAAADAEANAAVAEGNVIYVNHIDVKDKEKTITSHSFIGSGATKLSADASGNITIKSTDNDTHYVVSCTEDASGMSISLTPTNFVNGEPGKAGAVQTVTVSSWAYPDATQQA